MELKPGYKQTEIGVIPGDWEVRKIKDVFSIKAGGDFDSHHSLPYKSDTHQYPIYANALTNKGLYGFADYFTDLSNSLTVTARGMIGYSVYRDHPYVAIGRLITLQPKNDDINGLFLAEYLNSFVRFVQESTGVPQLTSQQIGKVLIPMPHIEEQDRISIILADIDSLITCLEKLIEKKKLIKQGVMQELLTGKRRLPGFNGEWEIKRLGDICLIRKGQSITQKVVVDGLYPVIAGGKTPAYYHNCYNRAGNTVSVSASGAYAGYVGFHRSPIFASDCSTLEYKEYVSVKYVYFWLAYNQGLLYDLQTGGAQPHVYPQDISKLLILFPKSHVEQEEIVSILETLAAEINLLDSKMIKTRLLKQAMMQELLTGRIRLI